MSASSNWNDVRQSLIDDIASFKNEFLVKASTDIKQRLLDEGVPPGKLRISSDKSKVSMETNIADEYEEGKVYFERVYEEVSKPSWLETIK